MKIKYIVNNYMLGAKVRSTQTEKIISQKRIDKNKTELVYDFINMKEKEFCDRVLSKKGIVI
ncbi:MAG TPA: hypothetical protein OIL97_04700 [Oscillospiraceae bacterium]|jgi:hypothetical protein|nr:hypothetical protein [Oscillospiraceae bacterium]